MSYPNVLARRPDRTMPVYGRVIGLAVSTLLLAALLPPAAQSLAMLADRPRVATAAASAESVREPGTGAGRRSASLRLLQESTLRAVRDGVVEAADARDLASQLRSRSTAEAAVIRGALRRFRSTLPEPRRLSAKNRRRVDQLQALLDLCLRETTQAGEAVTER